ncbi:MAG: ATP-dependent DNA helicase RecG [Nitrospirae bacterium]|nr:ATP-dependent DNA helicase RecG [Nitrospirota bacterium]
MDSRVLDSPVQDIKGIGPQRARAFEKIGIKSIRDAFYYLPFRYEDRTSLSNISSLVPGDHLTVRGRIISSDIRYFKDRRGGRLRRFELTVGDGSGSLRAVWFNQPYLSRLFRVGQEVILSGRLQTDGRPAPGLEMPHPEFEVISDGRDSFIHVGRVVPVYRVTEGITQRQFRKIMFEIVGSFASEVVDPMPPELISKLDLSGLGESLAELHFPSDRAFLGPLNSKSSRYHRRLYFDDLFYLELGMGKIKKNSTDSKGISFVCRGGLKNRFLDTLPYRLTGAQQKVVGEIMSDMSKSVPMQRLIQGDVGCGKTVVAFIAVLNAIECGYQAVLMAPTEVLAEQHFLTIRELSAELGIEIELLTGSNKKRRLDLIESGTIDLVIGTHALLQESVRFRRLGFVVIDEQHKFGVRQRALLRGKGVNPDVLVMTATPIPRSLALTIFADLDCSVIDELPPGRTPARTLLFESGQKTEIFGILKDEVAMGRQAYIVYPAIEESEDTDLKTAVKGKEIFEKIFPEYTFGLLHGKMPASEKEHVMALFKKKEIDILISTTVIEVGLDVPNASVMIVVHAERFGLAQLHQLRGRIGRGPGSSFCLLVIYEPVGEDARRRLEIIVKSSDGFRIAEEDLDIRGPGDFFGARQAGLPDMRVVDMLKDIEMIKTARKEAEALMERDPELRRSPLLRQSVSAFWSGKTELFKTG